MAALACATTLHDLERNAEARAIIRKLISVARREFGEVNDLTLKMRWIYADVLREDAAATLEDLREAVNMLEDTKRTARRVLGGAHPQVVEIERSLHNARAALRARETPSPGAA